MTDNPIILGSKPWRVTHVRLDSAKEEHSTVRVTVVRAGDEDITIGSTAKLAWYERCTLTVEHIEQLGDESSRKLRVLLRAADAARPSSNHGQARESTLVVQQSKSENDLVSHIIDRQTLLSPSAARAILHAKSHLGAFLVHSNEDSTRRLDRLLALVALRTGQILLAHRPPGTQLWHVGNAEDSAKIVELDAAKGWHTRDAGLLTMTAVRELAPDDAPGIYSGFLAGTNFGEEKDPVPTAPCGVSLGTARWIAQWVRIGFDTHTAYDPNRGKWWIHAKKGVVDLELRRASGFRPPPAIRGERLLIGKIATEPAPGTRRLGVVGLEPPDQHDVQGLTPPHSDDNEIVTEMVQWTKIAGYGALLALIPSLAFEREDGAGIHIAWQSGDLVFVRVLDGDVPVVVGGVSSGHQGASLGEGVQVGIYASHVVIAEPKNDGARLTIREGGRIHADASDVELGREEDALT